MSFTRLALPLATLLALAACQYYGNTSQKWNQTGQTISNAANNTGQAISTTANDTGQAITGTAHKVGNAFTN